jgi:hypothetical protein
MIWLGRHRAIRAGQQEIKAALRRLGVASDLSDLPLPPRGTAAGGQVGGRGVQTAGSPPRQASDGPSDRAWGEVADLVRCLAGAQANDIGWPVFNRRYVEYSRFRKEWWAHSQTYKGMSRMSWPVGP